MDVSSCNILNPFRCTWRFVLRDMPECDVRKKSAQSSQLGFLGLYEIVARLA